MEGQPGLLVARVVGDDLAAVGEQAQRAAAARPRSSRRRRRRSRRRSAPPPAGGARRRRRATSRRARRAARSRSRCRPPARPRARVARTGAASAAASSTSVKRRVGKGRLRARRRAAARAARAERSGRSARDLCALARALEIGDVGEPVGRRLEDRRVRALRQVALEQGALLVERERVDRLEIDVAEQREPSLEPLRIRFRPEAQLGMDTGCRPVDGAQRDGPEEAAGGGSSGPRAGARRGDGTAVSNARVRGSIPTVA